MPGSEHTQAHRQSARLAARTLVACHFPVSAGQEVLIIFDAQKTLFALHLKEALEAADASVHLVDVTGEPAKVSELLQQLADCRATGLLVLASHSMWVTGLLPWADFDGGIPRLRIMCTPAWFDCLLPEESLIRKYSAPPDELASYTEMTLSNLPRHRTVRVTSPAGTDLTLVTREWGVSSFSEVYTSPLEGSAQGTIVADLSTHLGRVSCPITLVIDQGRLAALHCPEPDDQAYQAYQAEMEQRLAANPIDVCLAELGIGLNPCARLTGVIMEDETVRGTAHFCFGDNSRFGGANRSGFHGGTVVIDSPALTVVE